MNAKQFGERVAALRKARGMTQAQLAEQLNVSNKAVSRWETGEGYPEITLLAPLAKALGVSIDQLLAEDDAGFYENSSGKKFYGSAETEQSSGTRRKELKHKEIPVEWPGLGLRDFAKNPYMWSNLLHFTFIAVLTGIVYSSCEYTLDGAGRYSEYACPEPFGYVIKAIMALALAMTIVWNIIMVKKYAADRMFVLRNVGISTFLIVGFQFAFTYINQDDVYGTMDPGTFLNHNIILVNRNFILLINIICLVLYLIFEVLKVYKMRHAAPVDSIDKINKWKPFWQSLTVFNKIGLVMALISGCGMILSIILIVLSSLLANMIHSIPMSMVALILAGNLCSAAAKIGAIATLIGFGAGVLDCYDRQYKASLVLAVINIAFAYLLPLLIVLLNISNVVSPSVYAEAFSMPIQ